VTDLRLQEAAFRARANGKPETAENGSAVASSYTAIEREPVRWLSPERVPIGTVTMLAGDPGLGKSMWTCETAATVIKAGGAVLLLTAEDSPGGTVRPRLEAAQADLDLVYNATLRPHGVEEGIALPDNVAELDRLVVETGAHLVVIDPLMAHLPAEVNSWRDQSVRTALVPLYRMAEERGCACVIVLHLNKMKGADPLHRVGGSIGIPGAVRSALLLARDPDDPEGERGCRRVLAHIKCNVAPLAPSLAYEIEATVLPGDERIETARLRLLGESDHSGHDLLDAPRGEERSALDEAIDFLEAELGGGERDAGEVRTAARSAGVSDRTLDRAKRELQVRAERVGGAASAGHWVWHLPNGANGKSASPISEFGALSANPQRNGQNGAAEPLTTPAETYGSLSADPPLELDDPAARIRESVRTAGCTCLRPGEVMSDGRCGRCCGLAPAERRGSAA